MPRVQVSDCSIFYEDIGWGFPILFLHSGYSRGIIAFSGQIQPFFRFYRCLLPDFRGHGRTISEDKDWDTPKLAKDMAEMLDALKIDQVFLVGYSLGGGVALHLAASQPERIHGVITIGTGGSADPSGVEEYEPEVLEEKGQTDFIESIKSLHAEAHGGDWRHHLRQSALDWRLYPKLSDHDWSQLTMPLLFIGGEHDSFASPQRLADMKQKSPHAEIWSVPGGSHRPHMPMEQVQLVNARMLAFLKAQKQEK